MRRRTEAEGGGAAYALPRPVRAIVLDLDWTLYDADAFYLTAWRRVAAAVAARVDAPGEAELYDGLVRTWRARGPSSPDLFDAWLTDAGVRDPGAVAACMGELHGDWVPELAPYDGVVPLLAALRGRWRTAVFTEGRMGTQTRKLRALGLHDAFDDVLISEELGAAKARGGWERAFQRLGMAPEQVLAVGDNPGSDIVPAARAGALTCRVDAGPYAGQGLDGDAAADVTLRSVLELPRVLGFASAAGAGEG